MRMRDDTVTDEEIRTIIAEAETAGVIEPAERQMISGVMRLGDRPVKGVMTPRTDVDWIDLTDGEAVDPPESAPHPAFAHSGRGR